MARITRVEGLMVDLKPKVKRVDAIQSFVSQETPIIRITDADGAVGTGYTYTIGTGGPAILSLIERTLAPALIGREAGEIERIWRDLLFMTHATAVGAITSLALAAIDTALWDLKARRASLPLHILAGGAQERIRLYTTEGGWLHLDTAAIVDDTIRAKESGFSGAKVKVGRPLHEDVARLSAVREAVGAGFEIFTDANQAFSVDEAIRRARAYEAVDIGWLEEPLPADDVDGHVRLAASTSVPVAVGESLYSAPQFRDYLQRRACSIVQVDVARIGGITPWLKVAHLAETFNVAVCPHFLMELHVALCAAVPNARWVEYIPQLDSLTTAGMRIEDGHAIPSAEAGLGIAWDFAAIDRMTVDGSRFLIQS
ncbi:mandelate racemase/muconate lactonizing enzyme family protein [Kaistia geumhonensis]|uniref:L-alanine-DL-glutamate epimerase-like enolase superfamily enzyme n=1 Tax=Kaistia geumhonensis TaxID=410839 RepID=A0ABU0M4S9_9HYPH|nr:mandelate racemase/muconate lactonizing enzyme family protein [Kaistia geumhonensis]MCX5478814.1 mandelate racemase/muconate lactonizing enzyme family protein [Kaistia geumhonensis]MDQ0515967.1 L-alanine-DL-glutamate epimerase-like enolase superfamily enzyme [Kaistia geumhonensis]